MSKRYLRSQKPGARFYTESLRSDYATMNAIRACIGYDPIPGTEDAKPIPSFKQRVRAHAGV